MKQTRSLSEFSRPSEFTLLYPVTMFRLNPTIEKHEAALLLLLGFAGFSVCLAILYRYLRRKVFKDSKKLDTVFDAGGRISVSLTAVTVTSQILWPSDLLMTATLISKVMYTPQNN